MNEAALIGISRHRIATDGIGVTTLVAFHGCPLHCKFCLNPQCLAQGGVWKLYDCKMPQWKPATQRGKAIKIKFTVPITFK